MTAPYFGLPNGVANAMRKSLGIKGIMPSAESLRDEQRRMINNAIILGQSGFSSGSRMSFDGQREPSSPEYDRAVEEFLDRRWNVASDSLWWSWLGEGTRRTKIAVESANTNASSAKPAKKTLAKKVVARKKADT